MIQRLTVFSLLLASFVIAQPALSQRDDLAQRDVYLGLWNESGPDVRDVKQVSVLNCWADASALAVLIASTDWMENLFHYGNGAPMVNTSWPQDASVQVTLWNPNDLAAPPTVQTASVYNKSTTEDHPDGNWWHDAISQSLLSIGTRYPYPGVIASNGTWDPNRGSAEYGLSILTGYPTSSKLRANYSDVDEFFDDLSKARGGTPVIFNTVDEKVIKRSTPMMGWGHDYAVYNGTDLGNGTRLVYARNSWGETDGFDLQTVWENTYQIIHLKEWNVLQWPGHNNTEAQQGSRR
ncbi:hypothetical protein IAR55_002677 [Kwoniella newhampshirensis]|uniref:Calpain catalytic domain-containing protein n=1 Tax=Kwoniella newhampshirensis TaxID=1651941 RepID=A0AAW0YZN8_9TREE